MEQPRILKLTGEHPRCWWCGRRIDGDPRVVRFVMFRKEYETVVCSEAHEVEVRDAYDYMQKVFVLFPVGMLGGLLLIAFAPAPLSFAGLLLTGVTLVVCPFATPQTVLLLGLRRSFRFGRIAGLLLALGGAVLWGFRWI